MIMEVIFIMYHDNDSYVLCSMLMEVIFIV